MTRLRTLLALAPLVLAGCAESSLNAKDYAEQFSDSGAATEALDGQLLTLRVDVVPPGGSGLLPQSAVYDLPSSPADFLSDLDVSLSATRSLSGEVRGFLATPYLGDIEVPGQASVPVAATVSLEQPFSLARATVDAPDGAFSLEVPSAADHVLAVVPEDGQRLPFLAVDPYALTQNETGEVFELGSGLPVYGTVTQDDGGGPLGTAQIWLEDLATGVAGPKVDVEPDGHFMVRALPGSYRVVAAGDSRSPTPRVTSEINVLEPEDGEAGDATRVDLGLGSLAAARTAGRVLDSSGVPLYQATIRFTSLALDQAQGSLVIEEDTPTDGEFSVDLLPGLWRVEVIPPYESSGDEAPLLLEDVEVLDGGVDLGDLQVPSRVRFTGTVLSRDGGAVANVAVVAREAGFDHYVYSTLTDADGYYEFRVPNVELEFAFMPSTPKETVTWIDYPADMERNATVSLADGERVRGTVTGPGGGALSGALVELKDAATDRTYGTALTDDDGGFAVRIALETAGGWAGDDAPDTGLAD